MQSSEAIIQLKILFKFSTISTLQTLNRTDATAIEIVKGEKKFIFFIHHHSFWVNFFQHQQQQQRFQKKNPQTSLVVVVVELAASY